MSHSLSCTRYTVWHFHPQAYDTHTAYSYKLEAEIDKRSPIEPVHIKFQIYKTFGAYILLAHQPRLAVWRILKILMNKGHNVFWLKAMFSFSLQEYYSHTQIHITNYTCNFSTSCISIRVITQPQKQIISTQSKHVSEFYQRWLLLFRITQYFI